MRHVGEAPLTNRGSATWMCKRERRYPTPTLAAASIAAVPAAAAMSTAAAIIPATATVPAAATD